MFQPHEEEVWSSDFDSLAKVKSMKDLNQPIKVMSTSENKT